MLGAPPTCYRGAVTAPHPAAANPNGIVLVDKPAGITSHGVVARVRRIAGTRKVGHAGTLDPMATGLLVLGLGPSTRLLTYLVGLDKEYAATIRLGQSTTTDDAEGEPLGEPAPTDSLSAADISAAIAAQSGDIVQVPSSVSAIKVNGQRAYSLARAGESVALLGRPVTVREFRLLEHRRRVGNGSQFLDLDVVVRCSSGTYIRALARDIGAALGVGGHLTALRRTSVGPFTVADAVGLEELAERAASGAEGQQTAQHTEGASFVVDPAGVAGRLFPVLHLTAEQSTDLRNGKVLPVAAEVGNPIAAVDELGRLIGLVRSSGVSLTALVNFPNGSGA